MHDHREPDGTDTELPVPQTEIEHPDPRTLCEPEHDEQGLLRWATGPLRSAPWARSDLRPIAGDSAGSGPHGDG